MSSITVSDKTKIKINTLKYKLGAKNIDAILGGLIKMTYKHMLFEELKIVMEDKE